LESRDEPVANTSGVTVLAETLEYRLLDLAQDWSPIELQEEQDKDIETEETAENEQVVDLSGEGHV
jgi:predicted chitinase